MLVEEEEIKYKSNCFLFFWKAPRTYIIPQAPPGHTYVPLEYIIGINFSRPIASYFPETQNFNYTEIFRKIYDISLEAIKPNIVLINYLVFYYVLMILFLVPLVVYFAYKFIFVGIICILIIIGLMVLAKIGNWCKQMGLKSNEIKLKKVLDERAANILEETGFIVIVGRLGLWLDFYREEYHEVMGNYDPPPISQVPI